MSRCVFVPVKMTNVSKPSELSNVTESEPADFMIECPRCHKLFGLYIKVLHSA